MIIEPIVNDANIHMDILIRLFSYYSSNKKDELVVYGCAWRCI